MDSGYSFLSTMRQEYGLSRRALLRIVRAVLLMFGVLMIGTGGYVLIEKWPLFKSFYMSVITISTVGFHEVYELSDHGRAFTIVLIFGGIGVGGYAIGTITAFLVEGQMMNLLKGRKMTKEIQNMDNHTIVCGYGKMGTEVCSRLASAGQAFVVIDTSPSALETAVNDGYIAAAGDATDDEVLEYCGIAKARVLISCISDESTNVYLVLSVKSLNEKVEIIVRGGGPSANKKLLRAGADHVVSPFEMGARRMAALTLRPDIVEFFEIVSPGRFYGLRLEKFQLAKNSRLCGRRLDESYIKHDTGGALVLAINKPGHPTIINPPGETELECKDTLFAIGNDEQLAALSELVSEKD